MAIFRGTGGSGDSTTDTTVNTVTQKAAEAAASATAAASSATQAANSAASINANIVNDTTPQLGGELDGQTNKITNIGDPTSAQDAATKTYVDSQVQAKDALSELSGDSDDITEGSTNLFLTTTERTKLSGIEASATADQTAAEIRTLVESASDSNVFTDADHSKLNAIEASATADQTDAEIKTAYENNSDTNAFTDAEKTKLSGIETGATADQTASEILTAIKTVDGSGSGLDADLLDGNEASAFATSAQGSTADSALQNVSEDTTPQLGGDLDLNSNDITGTGNINTTGAITVSGDATADTIFADGGNLIMGDEALSTSTAYVGMKTSNQSGVNDYMIISGTTDGNTYVSAKSGNTVKIRGGGNSSAHELQVNASGATFAGDLIVSGDLTVSGSTTTINTETINLADNNIVLNSNHTGTPTQSAGITIERGSSTDKVFQWNETNDYWETDDNFNVTGNITVSGTVDGRDLATDGTKLDGIEASADVTDTANVTSAGALMTSGGTVTSATTPLTATTSSSSGDSAAVFKRTASDGALITFQNDVNVDVGIISTNYNDMLIGTGDTGLYFSDSTDDIQPFNPTTTASRDDAISLGKSNRRFKNLYLSGDITVGGTVDGRDLATDGTKLDGIEASATADQTASEILTAIKTVDGAGSGLDADTLDGTELAALATDAEVAAIKQDIYNTAGAQYTLNGGGLVTVTNGNKIKWNSRILAIPVEKDEFSSIGYIQINADLTSGTITRYSGTSGTTTSTLDSDGITMPAWSGLYYQVTPGQSQSFSQAKLRLVDFTNADWAPEEGWLLLAVMDGDTASAGITFLPNGGVKFPGSVTSTFDTDTGVPSWLLPSSGGTMTGDLTGTQATTSASWTVLERFFANPAAESGEQTDVRLINDLAGFNKWGTETLTNVVTSHQGSTALTTLGNAPFDGYSSHRTIFQNANGDPNVILLELPHQLNYSCWVGIVFGATNWRAKSVKIETFRNGAYQTECDLTNQSSHIVARKVANNNNNGVTKIRITLDDYNNTSSNYCRIHTIFAVNYQAGNNTYGGVHYLSRFEDDEHYSNIAPATDSTYQLGTTSKRYSNVYSDALDVAGNIKATGNLGIGTTNPLSDIHIAKSSPLIRFQDTDNDAVGQILYNTASGGLLLRSDTTQATGASGSNIILETDGSEAMRVDSSGNVGIGTDSPAADLHVSNASGSELRIDTAGGTNADSVLNFRENTVDRAKLYWDGADNDLYLETTIGDIALMPTGNVGIGTTSPSQKLDVAGNINQEISGTNVTAFKINADLGTNENRPFEIKTPAADDTGTPFVINTNNSLAFQTDNATRLTVVDAGINVSGNIAVSGTVDGRDVAADGATADAALPKAGGTMTGNLSIESAAPILTLKDTTDNDDQRINFVDSSGATNYQIATGNSAGGSFHDAFSIINLTSNDIEIVDGSTKVVAIDGNGIDVTGNIKISGTDIFHQLEGDATNGAGFKNREIVSRGVFTTGTGACASRYVSSSSNNVIPAGNPNGYFFTNITFLANYLVALPISIPGVDESTTTSINTFVFRIGSQGASADTTIGMGLYTLNKFGLPSQLVSQGTASVATSISGLSYVEITPSVTAITPGRYALCISNLGASISSLAHNFTGGSGASPITDGFYRISPGLSMSCGLLWTSQTSSTMPTNLATVGTAWSAVSSCPLMSVSLGTAYSGE